MLHLYLCSLLTFTHQRNKENQNSWRNNYEPFLVQIGGWTLLLDQKLKLSLPDSFSAPTSNSRLHSIDKLNRKPRPRDFNRRSKEWKRKRTKKRRKLYFVMVCCVYCLCIYYFTTVVRAYWWYISHGSWSVPNGVVTKNHISSSVITKLEYYLLILSFINFDPYEHMLKYEKGIELAGFFGQISTTCHFHREQRCKEFECLLTLIGLEANLLWHDDHTYSIIL